MHYVINDLVVWFCERPVRDTRIKDNVVTGYFVPNETFYDLYDEVGGDLKLSTIFEAEALYNGSHLPGEGHCEFYDALDVFNECAATDRIRYSITAQVGERYSRLQTTIPAFSQWVASIAFDQVFELYDIYKAGPEALARVVELQEVIARKDRYSVSGKQVFRADDPPDRLQLISEYIESELLDKDFSDEWRNAWVRREIDTYKAWLVVRESREKAARFLAFMGGTEFQAEKIRLGPSPAVQALIDHNIVPDRDWWSNVTLGNIQDALNFPDIKNTLIGGTFTALAEKAQNTALQMAAVHSDLEVMVALIDAGASVNVWNFDGTTPVHGVVALDGLTDRSKSNGKLEALIAAGADLDRTDHWGQTALHWACGYWYHTQENEPIELSRQQVARKTHPALVLLQAGADTKIRNKMGKTALDLVQDAKLRCVTAGEYGVGWQDPYEASEGYQLLKHATGQ